MAQLWVATNEATGADVCVKVLVCEGAESETIERFRREAHAAARLSHRAIVRIFDLMELGRNLETITGGTPSVLAIVMELLHGETLGDYLMKKGKLSLDEAMDLALPFVAALAHAHKAGVVHRDVKPENIFLSSDPDGHVTPKVLDFGISKLLVQTDISPVGAHAARNQLTFDGVMLGTPSFMSPEQAKGARNVDARSDVFSAAIVLYMMLAGRNPFESDSFHSVVSAILQSHPPRLPPDRVPDAVWNVIERSLAKDMNARFADATELGIALRRASGRTTTTDSGAHSPASVRRLAAAAGVGASPEPVLPLGGTSIVTVPPVGNSELGDEPRAPRERIAPGTPAARQRAIRIVGAVVAVAVAMVIAAMLRGPSEGSSTSASSSGTATSAATSRPSAPVGPVQTAAPTATETAPASAPLVPVAPAETVAPALPLAADAGLAAPPPVQPPGPMRKRDIVAPDPTPGSRRHHPPTPGPEGAPSSREPSIVREPGF